MSNRLRRMDRFEREEECRGERWAYIVYGLSADARTDSARLKRMAWRRSKRSVVRRLARWLSADAPKPKRSLVDVVDRLMMIGFSAGLAALLLAWFMGWVLG